MLFNKQENAMHKLIDFLQKSSKDIVLFGASTCGADVLNLFRHYNIKVSFFCDDDPSKQGKTFNNIKVLGMQDLLNTVQDFWIVITSYDPDKIFSNLRTKRLDHKVLHSDFYGFEKGLDFYQYYMDNIDKINFVYNILGDLQSKKVYKNLLNYKISREFQLLKDIVSCPAEQYFDPEFMAFSGNEVFLDLGAYNGDTIRAFCENASEHKEIIAVEADSWNYEQLKSNTNDLGNITYYNLGIWNRSGVLNFNANETSDSAICDNGARKIRVETIDNLCMPKERITFIKADIEGAELFALEGGQQIIMRDKPKIAFCVYHKKEDIFEIPLKLYELNPNYKFYLRHYRNVCLESVIYAIDDSIT